MDDVHGGLVLARKPFGKVDGAHVDASSGREAEGAHETDHDPVVASEERRHEEAALDDAGGEVGRAATDSVSQASHNEQGEAPEEVESCSQESTLPVGFTHEVELLHPVVQGALVREVDSPGCDLGEPVTDVLQGADAVLRAHSAVGIVAKVLLLLDLEGNQVVDEGTDTIRARANRDVEEHVEGADAASSLYQIVHQFLVGRPLCFVDYLSRKLPRLLDLDAVLLRRRILVRGGLLVDVCVFLNRCHFTNLKANLISEEGFIIINYKLN